MRCLPRAFCPPSQILGGSEDATFKMGWWWKTDPQTPIRKASDPTPDPQPTASNPPASPRELADRPSEDLSGVFPWASDSQHAVTSSPSSDETSPSPSTSSQRTVESESFASYPTTMSCRAAFDTAFWCRSPGGQFNNIYRYGELRSCSEEWSAFWFCMRIKGKAPATKRALIQDHYRQMDEVVRQGPNSEHVWRERRPEERLKDPFLKDPDNDGSTEGFTGISGLRDSMQSEQVNP